MCSIYKAEARARYLHTWISRCVHRIWIICSITTQISPAEEEKVYAGNDLPKSQDLSSEWKTERVREDESGDNGDGEDDKLPCESEGDCIWRGLQRSLVVRSIQ